MTVSIIIAVKTYCANLKECVDRTLAISPGNCQILILPDETFHNVWQDTRVRIIPTGKVTPPKKRDIGAAQASGEFIAMLDDDAYPSAQWFSQATALFADSSLACVCGPAVTPDSDGVLEEASGLVYESFLVSGAHAFRYRPGPARVVDDFPSCNFWVRASVFKKAGGFNTVFWPGEDTFLCDKITALGGRMRYHPGVLVYHHRRPLFKKHLIQIRNYAMHRGYFAKKFGASSRKLSYGVPTMFDVFLVCGGWLSMAGIGSILYGSALAVYAACVGAAASGSIARSHSKKALALFPLVCAGIIATHVVYGMYFAAGLLARRMPEE